jgi:hypothetical protein
MDADELIPHSTGERGAPGFGPRSPAVDGLLMHSDPRTCWTSEHGYGALAVVTRWAKAIREDTTLDTPPDRMLLTVPEGRATMARELRTIRWHWHTVLASTGLASFAQEIGDVLHSLERAGRLTERQLRVGPCPVMLPNILPPDGLLAEIFDGKTLPGQCGHMLTVRADAVEIKCRSCETIWPRSRWLELGDPWADYAALADDLGVPVGTLWRWRREDDWRTERRGGRTLVLRADALESARKRGRWAPAA